MILDTPLASRRRGFGLPEIAIATVLLGVAIAMVGQGVVFVANARRGADRKQRAMQEAANVMENVVARPWNDLTPEFAKTISLDKLTSSFLNNGQVEVVINPTTGTPPAKKITVSVVSRDGSGNPQSPVKLVTWVYRHEGPQK